MEIMENASAWAEEFDSGWRAHLNRTGSIDWKLYQYARNRTPITGPGVDPAGARLIVISTAGAYLPAEQEPFDAANPCGDYSVRRFPIDAPLDELDYAHDHYDHTARKEDPRINLPLGYLAEAVAEGRVGSLAPSLVSFSGYQPDAKAVVDRMIPEILKIAEAEQAAAALLVPV